MPEGPEVRTIADDLQPLVGLLLTSVTRHTNPTKYLPEPQLTQCTTTQFWVQRVTAHGKKLLIIAKDGRVLRLSLGMTGCVLWEPKNDSTNYVRITFEFSEAIMPGVYLLARTVYFDDVRMFGRCELCPSVTAAADGLGPDLLGLMIQAQGNPLPVASIVWNALQAKRQTRRGQPICKVLLDQAVVAGIGNYLKSDILGLARVHPDKLTTQLSLDELSEIVSHACVVIYRAYQAGGYTMADYLRPTSQVGGYQPLFYNQRQDPEGRLVVKIKSADNRCSYITDGLQVAESEHTRLTLPPQWSA